MDAHEPRLAKHPKVLGGAGLGEAGLAHELPDRPRLLEQEVEYQPAIGLCEYFEGHASKITSKLYNCQGI